MTKIIELAHALGEEIARSEEMRLLELTKSIYDNDEPLQEKMREDRRSYHRNQRCC